MPPDMVNQSIPYDILQDILDFEIAFLSFPQNSFIFSFNSFGKVSSKKFLFKNKYSFLILFSPPVDKIESFTVFSYFKFLKTSIEPIWNLSWEECAGTSVFLPDELRKLDGIKNDDGGIKVTLNKLNDVIAIADKFNVIPEDYLSKFMDFSRYEYSIAKSLENTLKPYVVI